MAPSLNQNNGGAYRPMDRNSLQFMYMAFSGPNFKGPEGDRYRQAVSNYGFLGTVDVVEYAARTVTTANGGTYRMPKMTFIEYSDSQFELIDRVYGAIIEGLQTDPFFDDVDGMQTLEQTQDETLVSLRAATSLSPRPPSGLLRSGSQPQTIVGGVTAPIDWEMMPGSTEPFPLNRQVESIVETGGGISNTELILRVFHEFMHESFKHADNAFNPSGEILGNLHEWTAAEVRQLDRAYGGTERMLLRIAQRAHLSASEITALTNAQMAGLAQKYNERRLYELAEFANDILAPGGRLLSEPERQALLDLNLIEMEPYPENYTEEQKKGWREADEHYRLTDNGPLGNLSQDRQRRLGLIQFSINGDAYPTLVAAFNAAIGYARNFFGEFSSEIGQVLGSQLGRLVTDSQVGQLVASTTFGLIGQEIGQVIEYRLQGLPAEESIQIVFEEHIRTDVRNAAAGAVSSYLTAELFESLGLEGTLAELGQSVFSAHLSALITALAEGQNLTQAFASMGNVNVGNLIGGFIGTKLASELVEFDTVAGQMGATIGATIGATVGAQWGAKAGFAYGGPIGAAIGAFVGYIVGGLIGSLFGTPPRSGADVTWDAFTQRYRVDGAWAKGGAPREGARSLAGSAAEILNSVLELSGARVVGAGSVIAGSYGTHKKDFVFRITDASGRSFDALRAREAQLVINYGVAISLAGLVPRLLGGDLYAKRAIAATFTLAGLDLQSLPAPGESVNAQGLARDVGTRFDVTALLGNLSTAKDWGNYLQNRDQIDAVMLADPDSAFTATWTITFARAIELGLTKRGITDWLGGWNYYLDQAADGVVDGVGFTGAVVITGITADTNERRFLFAGPDGELLGYLQDTIDSVMKDRLTGTAGDDSIVVSGTTLTSSTSFTLNGSAAPAGLYGIKVAAILDGGAGNDLILAGDLGNDLIGGSGNDTLVGGRLDDWLFGDAGNDRLFAGGVNWMFSDGDAAGMAAALNASSNGDMLDGGDGEDVLYGSRGSDLLRGGAGVDTIYGGAGGDILGGGAGDDRGPNGEARIFGGGGTDQYVFGYGDGKDVVFDSAEGDTPGGWANDSIYTRLQAIESGLTPRNWAGGGDYEIDGSVAGGEDAVSFGPGITMQDIILQRSGTEAAPGQDLIIKLTAVDSATGLRGLTGDELVIKDWFESTHRVEWFRFANGEEVRLGDITSFIVGTSASDVIIGTYGADFLYGGEGNDEMRGLAGDDFGFGGPGNDLVAGDEDNDLVSGGVGDDHVIGGAGNDTAFGDGGNDYVYAGDGADLLAGGRGDDEVVGGAGHDIFRYERGDGRDILIDDYVDHWEVVWQNGAYINGYVLEPNSRITKGGVTVFDGSQWIGVYDYSDATQTLRRNLGALTAGGAISQNSGIDFLQFGVGVDIQDLMLRRAGSDLQIAIPGGESEASPFDAATDRITIRDWYLAGPSIEQFVFAATGRHDVTTWNMPGTATDGADTLSGTTGVDWITGNAGDDVITGGGGDDILSGHSGNDTIRGDAGNDAIYGGSGNDVLEGGAGADHVNGGAGFDLASYALGNLTVRAMLNAPATNTRDAMGDVYIGIEGLEGTAGEDRLGGNDNSNVLKGGGGNDTLYGGAGDDIYEIDGSSGQDTILDAPFITEEILSVTGVLNTTQYTAAWIYLGFLPTSAGNRYCYRLSITRNGTGEEVYRSRDTIDFAYTSSNQTMPGASSWPTSAGQWSAALAVMRTNNGLQAVREVFDSTSGGSDTLELGASVSLSDLTFERLNGNADLRITFGSGHHVTITGQSDVNRAIESLQLRDGLSADLTKLVLAGETASADGDLVAGDGTSNTLSGLAGDDILSGAGGNDSLAGGSGDDYLEGGAGSDVLDGGTDSITDGVALSTTNQTRPYGDTIRYVRSISAVQIDLQALTATGGDAAGDTIVAVGGVSTIENVAGTDTSSDSLRGDARANRLFGLIGNDTLDGRGGDDVLAGGMGNDNLTGGDGNDNLAGEDGDDTLNAGNGNDLLAGGAGIDTMNGDAGEDLLSGGDGNDVLRGGTEDDRIGGDAGDDQLYGDAGLDQLAGGEGNDTLYGGDGDDTLDGEAGNDQLRGEAGNDTYVLDAQSGSDILIDASGMNRIRVNAGGPESVWLARVGNDLRVSLVGGTASITVQGYYAASSPSLVREIVVEGFSLFAAFAEPLIQAMGQISTTAPASMPQNVADLLDDYWDEGGIPAPEVTDQAVTTAEDTALAGSVGASDRDANITGYSQVTPTYHGTLALNATTGAWTYTPAANYHGPDIFQIAVDDASGHRVVQTVNVTVTSVNDAPSDITLAGSPADIVERDHPPSGTDLDPVALGTLSATDVDAPDVGDFASHVFTVSDSRFEVAGGNQLRLRAGAALDFEAGSTVTLAITATDRNGAGLSYTKNFTFTVVDQDDYFYGTSGADTITGQSGRNIIAGFGGNDTLNGAGANDSIDGGDGADQLFGNGGNDTIAGGLGDDTVEGGTGADVLHGDDGMDTVRGGDGADELFGDIGNDTLQGGLLDDLLDGGSGNDRLEGDAGNDRLVGGSEDDTLIGGAGADSFLGGAGYDTVTYEMATAGITVNVTTTTGSAGDAAGDVFEDAPERLVGSSYGDTITGSSGADVIEGGAGNDTLHGGAGNDTLIGGDGNDTLDAQSGNDMLNGGVGSDILIGGDDNDTYLIDINSGADEIQNFDPTGDDIDVVGYQDITRNQLWFERSGDDLIVTAVGTSARTTIRNWYLETTAADRSNYKIDFFLAGEHTSRWINAEALVSLMAGYTRPATQAAFDALHATPAFENPWAAAWDPNAPPTIPVIANQTINEDGTLTLSITVTDDFTPYAGITVNAQAVSPSNYNVQDLSLVNAPTLSAPNGSGARTLTVTTKPNTSGQVAIKLTAVDAGGLAAPERVFLLNITPVADVPAVTQAISLAPPAPATRPTLALGSLALDIQSALVDNDGSESLTIEISGVPAQLSFNQGTNQGGGAWRFTPAQLSGLRIQGPVNFSQNVSMTVTATSTESANGNTSAPSTPRTLTIDFNAAPTALQATRTDLQPGSLSVRENLPTSAAVGTFTRVDPDSGEAGGDAPTYSLASNPGNYFAINSITGALTTNTTFNRETLASTPIVVRITDSGGLSYEQTFTINIDDVNEAPSLSATYSFSWNEQTGGAGTEVGTIAASDSDPTPAFRDFRYELSGAPPEIGINQTTGRLTLQAPLNYEAGSSYTFTARVWDGGGIGLGNSASSTVYFAVGNLNEAMTVHNGSQANPFHISEFGGGPSVYVGTVTATDLDGAITYYEILDGQGAFTMNAAGELRAQTTLNYETRSVYDLSFRALDVGGNWNYGVARVVVDNEQETPTLSFTPRPPSQTFSNYVGTAYPYDGDLTPVTYEIWSAIQQYEWITYYEGMFMGQEDRAEAVAAWFDGAGNLYSPIAFSANIIEEYPFTHYVSSRNVYITFRVVDPTGRTSNFINVEFYGYGATVWPIVLDMDGDGLELVPLKDSQVVYAMSEEVATIRTGWVAADDALLALDRNGDGTISGIGEISFAAEVPGATSDLEGLTAFDTNGNGAFDSGDERYAEFSVWQDANQDGVSQQEELRSLADCGIESISLARSLTGESDEGATENVITATSEMRRLDGSTGLVGDVTLAYLGQRVRVMDPDEPLPAGVPTPPAADAEPVVRQANADEVDAIDEVDRSSDVERDDLASQAGAEAAVEDAELTDSSGDWRETPASEVDTRRRRAHWARVKPDEQAPMPPEPDRRDARRTSSPYSGHEWENEISPVRAPGALHASLDSVARRRLQMIDAMATFSAEGASMLELQPHRRVDPSTLEWLTAVAGVRNVA